jgi:hypothetical protein
VHSTRQKVASEGGALTRVYDLDSEVVYWREPFLPRVSPMGGRPLEPQLFSL